ncbi:MAG: CoA transferase, partial [Acidimicrobiales bacterium]|nr:CoA transferase [Acidimicrobiales bacterium]
CIRDSTCIAPVYSVPELVDDPHLLARNAIVEADSAEAGSFRQLGPLLAGTVQAERRYVVPSADRTDTEDLLAAAGYDRATLAQLRDQGVIA